MRIAELAGCRRDAERMARNTKPRDGDPRSETATDAEVAPLRHWGCVTTTPGRCGDVVSHLLVFPPDCSPRERYWARRSRLVLGIELAAVCVGALALLQAGVSAALIVVAGVGVLAVSWMWLRSLSAEARRRAASLWSCSSPVAPSAAQHAAEASFVALSRTMESAVEALEQGRISTGAFLRIWSAVYSEASDLAGSR